MTRHVRMNQGGTALARVPTSKGPIVPRGSDELIVLADVSGSMETVDGSDRERRTRFALMKQALDQLPKGVRIIAFSDFSREVRSIGETRPDGGTALDDAIRRAAGYKPVRTVIISDGEPNSEDAARKEIGSLTGIVDVIYCGDPKNHKAREFLESLARSGKGKYYETGEKVDIEKQMPAVIKGLLGGKK